MRHKLKISFLTLMMVIAPSCTSETPFNSLLGTSCHDFVPVEFEDGIICVSPDYYMIDNIRTPVGMTEALRIAEIENAFLPTPDMVDAIWQQADLRLTPIPMTPGPMMTSVDYYVRHDQLIDEVIGDREYVLIAGHKKDIVQPQVEGRVTIYGWHRGNGIPIQPVSSVHGSEYYDYSHGLRLVRLPW